MKTRTPNAPTPSAVILITCIILGICVLYFGCGSDTEHSEDEIIGGNPITMGSLKQETTVAAAPQAPNMDVPHVKKVGYYHDWQLTKPIIDSVRPGDTIYTKVVFSEPMLFAAAEDKTSRPILYYRIGGLHRYRMVKRGMKLASGVAKPKGSGTDNYVCKYVVPKNAGAGKFTLAVGKRSASADGTPLDEFYAHKKKVTIQPADTTPPTITEVSYYGDGMLTKPLTGTVEPGTTIYTKIVFSEPMRHVTAEDNTARPALFIVADSTAVRYRVKAHNSSLANGDCKPLQGDTNTYLCRYAVPRTTNTVALRVGYVTADTSGNRIAKIYVRTAPFAVAPTPDQKSDPVTELKSAILPQPESEEEAARKANILMKWINFERISILGEIRGISGLPYGTFGKRFEERVERRIGISKDLWIKLYYILFFESPHGVPVEFEGDLRWFPETAYEYMRLRYLHPERSEDELVEMFRQSAHAGKVKITGLEGIGWRKHEEQEAETLLFD